MIRHSRPWLTDGDKAAVAQALDGLSLADGSLVSAFAAALHARCGGSQIAVTGSGTIALILALQTVEIGPGDEVIAPTYVCPAVLHAIHACGAAPRLCDSGPHWNVRPEEVAPHVTARTRALIVPQLFGIARPVAEFRCFGVPIVNDLAQSFDAALGNGDRGDVVVLSFHAVKCLSTMRGGAVFVTAPDFAKPLQRAALAWAERAPMADPQAALGLAQLARYGEFQARRAALASRYFGSLAPSATEALALHRLDCGFYRFPLRQRAAPFEQLAERFAERGVVVRRGVDTLLHRIEGLGDALFPNAIASFNETVSIPFYPALTDTEAGCVIDVTNEVVA